MSQNSSAGVATRYGLHGPGTESRWERDFPHPSRLALRSKQLSLFRGVKQPGHGVDHTLSSSADVKERVELYLYSPSGI
jgi:hypothetical protein